MPFPGSDCRLAYNARVRRFALALEGRAGVFLTMVVRVGTDSGVILAICADNVFQPIVRNDRRIRCLMLMFYFNSNRTLSIVAFTCEAPALNATPKSSVMVDKSAICLAPS